MTRLRDDRGAVAVIFAMVVVVLFGAAALTVDLGKMYVAKNVSQRTVDAAVLAGGFGDGLPRPDDAEPGGCYGAHVTDDAVQRVADYVTVHSAFGAADPLGTLTFDPADLVDCDRRNGEVGYGTFGPGNAFVPDKEKLSVIAPPREVSFGFAGVFGDDSGKVITQATAQVKSPLIRSLPLYAVSGCDYGLQTIGQPTNGHAVEGVSLSHTSDDDTSVTLTSLTTSPATNPPTIPLNAADPDDSLVINGTGLTGVTEVGFFESRVPGVGPEPVVVPVTAVTATQITIDDLPTAVTGVETVWYVRVKKGSGPWSRDLQQQGSQTILRAPPLWVGSPTVNCVQGSSDGNFGTLLLPHSLGPSSVPDNIAYNIATNIEHSLGIYPNAQANWLCSSADPAAKLWPADGTNCVDTKTGLDLNAAQKGFLDGVAGKPGRLRDVRDGTGCADDGKPAQRALPVGNINNDTLSCFFTEPGVDVGDVAVENYQFDHPVISPAIYQSPRFAMVPVFEVRPNTGGSNKYQVVDMRAAFITDQTNSATRDTPATADNGITFQDSNNNRLHSIQVVFFNTLALPPPPDWSETVDYVDYLGKGVKVLRLVD